jgi:hypothetical protein
MRRYSPDLGTRPMDQIRPIDLPSVFPRPSIATTVPPWQSIGA